MKNNTLVALPCQLRTAPIAIAAALVLINVTPGAAAATLSVGPGKTFAKPCQALTVAASGDVVEIDGSVSYAGDVCAFAANNLTIRGVNGRPKIDAAGQNAGGKGTWVVQGSGTVIENVEMFGAKVPDLNGAAIRLDGVHLTVRKSYIHDNEMGILTNNDGISNIVIENTEFGGNGYGNGFSHNVYVGAVNSLTFRYNYSHDANVGHNLKSRAKTNTISYSRFSSSGIGQPSYEIDLPNAGTAYVIGNVIQQPANQQNVNLLAYGTENVSNPGIGLYVVNNTFINDYSSAGNFILVGGAVTIPALIQNNVFAGTGTITNQTAAILKNNFHALLPAFVDRANYDLRPAPGAQFIDAGSPAGTSSTGISLAATNEYVHLASNRVRTVSGQIDIGAYEAAAIATTTTTAASTTTTVRATTTTAAASTTTAPATTTTAAVTTTTAASTTTTAKPSTTTGVSTTTTAPSATTSTVNTTTTTTAGGTVLPDTIQPTVTFLSPANGARVSGTVKINLAATDNKALSRVTLSINGRQVASQSGTAGALTYSWNTRWLRGSQTLTATAVDAAGNQASSSIVVYR